MFHWIFLAGLNQAVNLFHFIGAHVAKDGSQVLLVTADSRQDNVTVKDPRDIAVLFEVFQAHALKRLEPATATQVAGPPDNRPLPSAPPASSPGVAATGQLQMTLVSDSPLAGTGPGESLGGLQEAPGAVELPEASSPSPASPFASQPAPAKTAEAAKTTEPPPASQPPAPAEAATTADAGLPAETGASEAKTPAAAPEPAASQETATTADAAQDEPPAKPAPKKSAPFGGRPFGN